MSFERTYVGSKQPPGFPGLPSGWHTEPLTFLSADGTVKLFAALHRKTNAPIRRLLTIAHGFGEHGGRYQHFPHFLQEKFDAIFVPDHRGHGRSEGQRGHAERFDLLVEDFVKLQSDIVLKLSEEVSPQEKVRGDLEFQILGHSLGGHLVIRLAHLHPELKVHAYHLSAPFLGLKAAVSPVKRGAAHLLTRVWGNLSLRASFDATVLSHDPNVVQNYCSDRLNHDRMTPQLYVSMTAAMKDTLRNFRSCSIPIQLLLPTADPLVDSEVSRKLFKLVQCTHSRVVELEGFRHEPMNDIGKEKFFEALMEFPAS